MGLLPSISHAHEAANEPKIEAIISEFETFRESEE
jgi:hypothetical protein